jgi:linoleoyl-CoA desaturase
MNRIKFPARSQFQTDLNTEVDRYFENTHLPKTGTWRMFLKTSVILFSAAAFYTYLVFYANTYWGVGLSMLGMAFSIYLVGFNIMHDGAHGSYAKNPKLNWLMGFTLDLMGGSNYLWRQKHNFLHHTYTNIDEYDRDLQSSGLMRLSPDQPWQPFHRYQHLYAIPLYSLHTIFWLLYRDYVAFFAGKVGPVQLRKPNTYETVLFFMAKAFVYLYSLVIPLFFHPVWHVLLVFVIIHLILGITLSLVFQLAHATEGPVFPKPNMQNGHMQNAWAIHQVETTADFAPNNRWAAWCFGGLNFQIEHHLYPDICHIHYPAISKIVRQQCEKYGITYHAYPTVWAALKAHFKFLYQMAHPSHQAHSTPEPKVLHG